jgi:hypothetical protein
MTETAKGEALEKIAAIARQYDLSADEITAALRRYQGVEKSGSTLSRILGYLGGAFIFGGLALFIGMQWEILGSAGRIIITYGAGLVAFILGLITLKDIRYQNASTPLFLAAAAMLPTGMFVFLKECFDGGDSQLAALVIFSLMAFQYLGCFFKFYRTSLLFCGYLFYNTALVILMDRAGVPGEWIGIIVSVSILMICSKIDQGPHRAIVPVWHIFGSMVLLMSAYDILEDTPFDIILLILSVVMIFFSVQMRSRSLLLVNTLGLFSFLGYYTSKYFANVVGWPIALIFMGFLLVGVSAGAMRLDKRIKEQS